MTTRELKHEKQTFDLCSSDTSTVQVSDIGGMIFLYSNLNERFSFFKQTGFLSGKMNTCKSNVTFTNQRRELKKFRQRDGHTDKQIDSH